MLQVSAGVIYNDTGEVLVCQRNGADSCALLWEFPGGKQEPNETAQECLMRECREELSIEVGIDRVLACTVFKYPEREIAFTFFAAHIISGTPKALVHNTIKWAQPKDLDESLFCPADVEMVRLLKGTAN